MQTPLAFSRTADAATSVRVVPISGQSCSSGLGRFPAAGLLPLLEVPARTGEDTASESVVKRAKFAQFEKACSRVADGLYVSGEYVAKSRELLAEHGITHVVNCVGAMYPGAQASSCQGPTVQSAGGGRGLWASCPWAACGCLCLRQAAKRLRWTALRGRQRPGGGPPAQAGNRASLVAPQSIGRTMA